LTTFIAPNEHLGLISISQPCFVNALASPFYAALLPRRGPHIASHSVCLSVRPSRYRASRRAT